MDTLTAALSRARQHFPDREAFTFREQRITFSDLHRRSESLAKTLIRDGLMPGDRVGIYLGKGLESVIAVYGIMRAGGAYVPIDPALPQSRIAFVLEDCGIKQLITDSEGLKRLGRQPGGLPQDLHYFGDLDPLAATHVCGWTAIDEAENSASPVLPTPAPGDLAYVMYTSGSTGHPKGICHTHESGLAYARAATDTFNVTDTDRLSGFAPLHFDQSTFHLFAGVLRGATTVIIPEEYGSFPVNLGRLIEQESITIWYSVPFVLMQLATRGALEGLDLSALRWVKFGGEAFPVKYLRQWMTAAPKTAFANIYGPAEVNQCTHHVITAAPADGTTVPIGKPWNIAELFISDADDREVKPGDPGLLQVKTSTMMRGYWNRPDLDAAAFRRETRGNPGVFYRTGDLVRMGQDGALEFLGREDRQVKTRGFRVELDEVEAALMTHPDVVETAVYLVPGPDDARLLEAAVIARPGVALAPPDLIKHLAQRLARYAIPASFEFAEDFPRTGSGKINRRALSAKKQNSQEA